MRHRVQFSLLTLLVVTTAVASFFGYSQRRRENLLRECASLEQAGVTVALRNSWQDKIWQRPPTTALIPITVFSSGKKAEFEDRLRALGVETIHWAW